MKKAIVAALASLILGVGTASAADMAVKAAPPPVPTCIWCGFYIGANAGGIWSNSTAYFGGDAVPGGTLDAIARGQIPVSISPRESGFIGGIQAGFNQQRGAFVWGIEGDVQGTTLDR